MEQYYYIIRHGETDYNKTGMVQGSGINSDLNELGRQQAEAFYEYYKDHPFDKIFVSGLKRTHQSVQGFIEKGIPFEVVEELNEICWGDFEGVPINREMHKRYLNIIDEWQKGNLHLAYNNAESPLQLFERQKKALHKIRQDKESKHILIATHGRYLRSFLCLLLDHPLHRMDDFIHSNLCLYVIRNDGERFHLIQNYNTDHLTKKPESNSGM